MKKETAMTTEQRNDRLTISVPEKKQSKSLNGDAWRIKQLVALAEVFKEPLTPECIAMYVESLNDLSDDHIKLGIGRAIRELEWFPKPAHLRELAGAEGSATSRDAEGRAAWDVLMHFVTKYVGNDFHGNYGPEHGWYSNFPKLSDQILDAVRRTGGWRTYKCMTDKDFAFVQKRFLEEYRAWTAVERIDLSKLLTQLPAHRSIGPIKATNAASKPRTPLPRVPVKRVPAPPTDAQTRDRREMLRQQAAILTAKQGNPDV